MSVSGAVKTLLQPQVTAAAGIPLLPSHAATLCPPSNSSARAPPPRWGLLGTNQYNHFANKRDLSSFCLSVQLRKARRSSLWGLTFLLQSILPQILHVPVSTGDACPSARGQSHQWSAAGKGPVSGPGGSFQQQEGLSAPPADSSICRAQHGARSQTCAPCALQDLSWEGNV